MITPSSHQHTPYGAARELTKNRRMTAKHVAVFYIAGQTFGKDVADYYQSARAIPAENTLAVNYSWDYLVNTDRVTVSAGGADGIEMYYALRQMADAVRGKNIHAIVLAGYWPKRVYNDTSTIGENSNYINLAFDDYVINVLSTAKNKDVYATNGEYAFHLKFRAEYDQFVTDHRAPYMDAGNAIPDKNVYRANTIRATGHTRIPLDHEDQLRIEEIENPIMVDGDADRAISYMVFRLSAPYVYPADTANGGSSLAVVKRMIDDGIAFEKERNTDLTGNALISGTTTPDYIVGAPALYSLKDNGFDSSKVFHEQINNTETKGTATPFLPDVAPATNYPAGNTTCAPTASFNKVSNVELQIVGNQTYYSKTYPYYNRDSIEFQAGGIAGHAQSYGTVQAEYGSADPFFGSRTLEAALNVGVRNALFNTADATSPYRHTLNIRYANDLDSATVCNAYRIRRNMADDSLIAATVEVTSDNTIVLRETDTLSVITVVATITITDGTTLVQQLAEIQPQIPANWTISEGANGSESRAIRAILNGACVSMGSAAEPRVFHGFGSGGIISSLLEGACMAEALRNFIRSPAYNAPLLQYITKETIRFMCVYGDPLYRPYGERENK